MDLPTEREELLAAWRALTVNCGPDGWNTIPFAHRGRCKFRAGRHFPGNQEALLVGFRSARVPHAAQLPQGQGFLVSRAEVCVDGESCQTWIALSRQSAGSLDLFLEMAFDIVSTLRGMIDADENRLLQVFLSRIRAWQDFMRRGADRVLGPEAELGLFGELELLRDLLTQLPALTVVEAWRGPLRAIHDFSLGRGAIEVKCTAQSSGFCVQITSLEQLDDSEIRPIYLAVIRLVLNETGRTLPEQVSELREILSAESLVLRSFDDLLLRAGFLHGSTDDYTRRFSRAGLRIMRIFDGFPRLTRFSVPAEIVKASYEIDIDRIPATGESLAASLRQLGVI